MLHDIPPPASRVSRHTGSQLLHPSSGPQQCPSHLHSIQSVHHAGMQACVQTCVTHHTRSWAPGDTDRGRGVPPVIDRPAKATFSLPVSARAWCPSIGRRRPSSWPVPAMPVRHGRRRVRVRPPSSLSLWGKPQVPSPCEAKGLAAVSQARSKATKSIPCALGRALHGGMRSGDDGSKYALPALFLCSTSQPAVPTRQPPVVATARHEKRSEHCHVTVQGLDGAGSAPPSPLACHQVLKSTRACLRKGYLLW
jgi:hypothetical protein